MTERHDDDDALIERVRRRVMEAIAEDPRPFRTVRTGPEGWQTVAPGIERKLLWAADGAQSCLLRLAPGARVEGHLHRADEECVVLEGSVRIGSDLVLHAGDFHVGLRGTTHPVTTSDTGAVVYLRGAADASTA